ncbi:MAG: cob(I)yrinic acid a,c-diamide adenosyltransferase [Chloroflexota bacterium]
MTKPIITGPTMRPYGRQLFICNHGDCADTETTERIHRTLMDLCRTHGMTKLRNPHRTKCTLADCMGVCQKGPIVTVYPDGVWYHSVDETVAERIFHEHVLGGQPVTEYIFHQLYPVGELPEYAPELRGDDELEQFVLNPEKQASASQPSDEVAETRDMPNAEEVRAAVRKARKKKGLVIVNTGEGKGKTTAALGILMRAWGRQMKIGVMQFLKNENARFGEIKAASRMGDIDWISTGDGWTWTSQDMDETEARARHAWQLVQERILSSTYDLMILDEFTYPLHYGWLDINEVLAWLEEHKPPMMHLIITGRYAPQNLVDFADLVTEMREVKHPFSEQGIRAQAGIEY